MNRNEQKQFYAIKYKNENIIKRLVPNIQPRAGIYIFYRTDEVGIRYAYVGKAETNILERLASHLSGYDSHIDRSIKSHKLYSKDNPYGYKVKVLCYCQPSQCDSLENKYIVQIANSGYQMRNVETGGTLGKGFMNDKKQPKGYKRGVLQGKKSLASDLKHIIDLHLDIKTKKDTIPDKKALDKFNSLINEALQVKEE